MTKVAFLARAAAAAGLLAAVMAQPASAADLFGRDYGGSIKDAPYAFSWTGVYVGAHAGLMTGNTQGGPNCPGAQPFCNALFGTDYDMNGGLFGGHIGYNYQMGSTVLGIEASYSGSNAQGDGSLLFGFLNSRRELDWLATVTGRLGYAMGRSLVYVKGGVAWGDLQTDVSIGTVNILSGGETHVGWTAGLGFEHALTNNVTVRIEYAHIDLDTEGHALSLVGVGPIGVASQVEAEFDTLSLGVSYKF
ncbi:MAG: outer membrane beta-barrel protein [Hyphomicrobiaceae bacterium]|nr:outer membrane beta-barrel protein [Hyphomicrobiaceae bacterium]